MIIKTRIFELADRKYRNLSVMAKAMGLSVSQVYRVKEGKRGINEKFIVGAKKAFPEYRLDEMFYFHPEPEIVTVDAVRGGVNENAPLTAAQP